MPQAEQKRVPARLATPQPGHGTSEADAGGVGAIWFMEKIPI
ncbi:hypothetical protein AEYBE204_18650 [Asticcacaulis sp. YBE204]|nr:hypothetical protein AEYBE204_18650 [Asticcacaulis sp. YBE204]